MGYTRSSELYRCEYSDCKLEELQRFVQNRTGKPASTNATHSELIGLLNRLDREPSFDCFFDLPPELRNSIYELVLQRDRTTRSKATLGLLRTSKQVYQETKSILEAEATAYARASFYHDHATWQDHTDYCSSLSTSGGLVIEDYYVVQDTPGQLDLEQVAIGLSRIDRVQKLVLEISIIDRGLDGYWHGPIEFLSYLVRICTKLRILDVEVVGFDTKKDQTAGRQELLEILLPLIQLPSTATLRLHDVPEEVESEFWRLAAEA